MDDETPLSYVVAQIRARLPFSHSGLWADWWHGGQLYAVFFNALHLPVAAWREGKWFYANDLRAQPFAGTLAEQLCELGEPEVQRVTPPELCAFIHTGEPPTPAEVRALLSACPD